MKQKPTNIKILVKTDCDWADEADLEGFATFEPREWEYTCKEINACKYPIEWQWGSNQWVIFESADDVFRCFDVSVLTTEETEIIERRFIKYGEYGMTPFACFQGNAVDEFYKANGFLRDYLKKG